MFAQRLVVRDVEVVELGAVVVADQAGHLLEMFGLELDDGRGAEAMRLLPAGDQRLAKQAADGLPAEEAQIAGTRGEAEQLLGPGRAQPLEIDGQLRRVEVLALGRRRKGVRRQGRRRRLRAARSPAAVRGAQPAVLAQTIFWIAVSRPSVQRPRLRSGRPQR